MMMQSGDDGTRRGKATRPWIRTSGPGLPSQSVTSVRSSDPLSGSWSETVTQEDMMVALSTM